MLFLLLILLESLLTEVFMAYNIIQLGFYNLFAWRYTERLREFLKKLNSVIKVLYDFFF